MKGLLSKDRLSIFSCYCPPSPTSMIHKNSLIFSFFQSYWPSGSRLQLSFDSATCESKIPSRIGWIGMRKKPNMFGLDFYIFHILNQK